MWQVYRYDLCPACPPARIAFDQGYVALAICVVEFALSGISIYLDYFVHRHYRPSGTPPRILTILFIVITGVSDYTLYRPNGEIIAIVEAKRTSIDPRLAQTQAEFYVTQLEKRQSFRPFAFMTNGNDIYFLDTGQANKRLVSGFFSAAECEYNVR